MLHSPGFLKLVEAAKKDVKELPIAELKGRLAQGAVLIDVREESEWAQGHLPHATHLSKGIIERDIEQRHPKQDQALILYCGGGYRSILAAHNLQRMGYTQILSLEGGFRAWTEQKLPIVRDDEG